MNTTKRCARCGQDKPIEQFRRCPCKYRPNKRHGYCQDCMIAYLREYRKSAKAKRFAKVLA